MKMEELERKLEKILDFRMDKFYSLEELMYIYNALLSLKNEIINFSLIELADIEKFDYLRFRTLEEIFLVKMDIRQKIGLEIESTYLELEKLYLAS